MKFWFTHSSGLSLQTQIIEQVRLGLASGELAPGERLPSVRALARMYGLHSNTVSSAYSELERLGLVEHTRGGGSYAAQRLRPDPPNSFASLVQSLRSSGMPDVEITALFHGAMHMNFTRVLVEPDDEAARLILFELQAAGGAAISVCRIPVEFYVSDLPAELAGRTPVVLPSKLVALQEALGRSAEIIVLEVSTFTRLLDDQLPSSRDHLLGVASHWPRFVEIGRALFLSAGFHPDSLVCRDARLPGWHAGLECTSAVLCDSYTDSVMPEGVKTRVFPLLSERTLALLKGDQAAAATDAPNGGS